MTILKVLCPLKCENEIKAYAPKQKDTHDVVAPNTNKTNANLEILIGMSKPIFH